MSERPRRILHILWSLQIGGKERAVYQLAREQRRRGDEADIAVGGHNGLYARLARDAGADVHELGQRQAADITVWPKAKKIFRDYDVLHFHSAEPVLAAVAARMPARKYYTHRAGASPRSARRSARYMVFGRYVRGHFDGVSGNTRHGAADAARLLGLDPKGVAVTYNGIDFDLLRPERPPNDVRKSLRIDDDRVVVGTSGNLRAWKRIDRLLEAVAGHDDRGVVTLIVGDGPARHELERLATSLGIANRIAITGMQEHVGDYLQIMDIFVLPSGQKESFGNAAVEAMAVGLPVIVFADGGGVLEHIEDQVTGVVVDGVGSLRGALAALARNPDRRRVLGKNARKLARDRYSLAAMAAAYDRLYSRRRLT
jgi:glycosyltransferase involved in cell wall biosynthesis